VDERAAIDQTRRWIELVVIGLNLCPFARRVFAGELIRYVVTPATVPDALLSALAAELTALASAPRSTVETTLLVHPNALTDFLDYNDFLADADRLIDELGLRGVIQIASFHPQYRFAGTKPDAVENYTNRSPYPMLHLLREESVSEVNRDPAVMVGIPEQNIATMRALGRSRVLEMLKAVRKDDPPSAARAQSTS
jgi:uncharacterized protein